jgi:hypothetical protein
MEAVRSALLRAAAGSAPARGLAAILAPTCSVAAPPAAATLTDIADLVAFCATIDAAGAERVFAALELAVRAAAATVARAAEAAAAAAAAAAAGVAPPANIDENDDPDAMDGAAIFGRTEEASVRAATLLKAAAGFGAAFADAPLRVLPSRFMPTAAVLHDALGVLGEDRAARGA